MGSWVERWCLQCLDFAILLLALHDILLFFCIHDNARSPEDARLTSSCVILSKLPEPGVAVGHLHFFSCFDFLHKLHIVWRGFHSVVEVKEHNVVKLASASVSAFHQVDFLDARYTDIVLILHKAEHRNEDILDVFRVELVIDARDAERRDLDTSESHFEQVGFVLVEFAKGIRKDFVKGWWALGGRVIMDSRKNLFQFFFNLPKSESS